MYDNRMKLSSMKHISVFIMQYVRSSVLFCVVFLIGAHYPKQMKLLGSITEKNAPMRGGTWHTPRSF